MNMGPFMLFGRGQTEFASTANFALIRLSGDGRAACSESPACSESWLYPSPGDILTFVILVILRDAIALSCL